LKKIEEFDNASKLNFSLSGSFNCISSWIEYEDECPNISIGYGVSLNNCKITVHKGGGLIIKDLCELRGRIIVGEGCKVEIGYGLVCNDAIYIQTAERGSITIKDDCLFANPKIYNSDLHSIFDLNTGSRTNFAKDVVIGNRVWLARDTLVLKGANIGDGSILGAGSTFNGKSESNALLVGSPAKVAKKEVVWSRYTDSNISKLLPIDFPAAKFRSNALQFNHDKVIELGINIWENRKEIRASDYYALYYLSRSILIRDIQSKGLIATHINDVQITAKDIFQSLLDCYELSGLTNIACGSFSYLAAQLAGLDLEAKSIYEKVKSRSNHIDNPKYKA